MTIFKMLVVLHGTPGAAPGETVLDEELVAEIFCRNLITEILLTIYIRYTCSWLNDTMAVFLTIADVRVIKGIDVDG